MLFIGGKENRSEFLRFGRNIVFIEKVFNNRKFVFFTYWGFLDNMILF